MFTPWVDTLPHESGYPHPFCQGAWEGRRDSGKRNPYEEGSWQAKCWEDGHSNGLAAKKSGFKSNHATAANGRN